MSVQVSPHDGTAHIQMSVSTPSSNAILHQGVAWGKVGLSRPCPETSSTFSAAGECGDSIWRRPLALYHFQWLVLWQSGCVWKNLTHSRLALPFNEAALLRSGLPSFRESGPALCSGCLLCAPHPRDSKKVRSYSRVAHSAPRYLKHPRRSTRLIDCSGSCCAAFGRMRRDRRHRESQIAAFLRA